VVFYRRSFETVLLSWMVAPDITCKIFNQAYSNIEITYIDSRFVFRGKIGGYNVLTFSTLGISQLPRDTPFELLTVAIGPRASLLQYSDLFVENAL